MSTESFDLSSCENVTVAEARSLTFDTQAPFEQWLQSLDAPALDLESTTSTCEVVFDGELHVNGLLTGNIRSAQGTLVMSPQGRVKADVDVRVALIDGHLEGTLRATEYVVLDRNARVAGNIHTPSLTIKDGAVFEGTSFMLERSIYAEICEPQSSQATAQAMSAGA